MPNEDNLTPREIERRLEILEGATKQLIPSDSGTLPTPTAIFTVVASGVVGASQATIPHGLGYIPTIYGIVMTTAGIMYQSAAPDVTNVYVFADTVARQANIIVGR